MGKTICTRGYVKTQSNYIYRTLQTNNSAPLCPFSSYTPISSHSAPPHSSFSHLFLNLPLNPSFISAITKVIHTKTLRIDRNDWKQKERAWLKDHIIESTCSYSTLFFYCLPVPTLFLYWFPFPFVSYIRVFLFIWGLALICSIIHYSTTQTLRI